VKKTEPAPVDTRQRTNTTEKERFERYENTFTAVTESYIRTRHLEPVIAFKIDPDPTERAEKLTLDGIHFCCDVEAATEKALANRLDLQAAWFSLVAGEFVERKLSQQIITLCGRIYIARDLSPHKYFRPNKHPRKRGTR